MHAFVDFCQAMSIPKNRIPQSWPANANRFRNREQGAVMTLKFLKIIGKPRSGSRIKLNYFIQGHETHKKNAWVIRPSADCAAGLVKFIAGCDVLVKAVGDAPDTVSSWIEKMTAVKNGIDKLKFKVPRLSGVYLVPWFGRSYMDDLMAMAGAPMLRCDDQASIAKFCTMNPDQSNHLDKLRHCLIKQGEDVSTLRKFVKALGLTGYPLQYVSMLLCFCGDRGFRNADFADFNVAKWMAGADALLALDDAKLEPLYVLVAQKCRAD